MAPKLLLIKFLIFCLEAEISKFKFYFYIFKSSHDFKAREKFIKYHFLLKHLT